MNKKRTIRIPFDLPFEVGDLIEYDYVGAIDWGFTGIYLGMGEEEDNRQDHCKFFILKGKFRDYRDHNVAGTVKYKNKWSYFDPRLDARSITIISKARPQDEEEKEDQEE
jgi:hypothetical protein